MSVGNDIVWLSLGVKLYIRHMVCARCKLAVSKVLEDAGLAPARIDLGEATLNDEPTPEQLEMISTGLNTLGFELIDDRKSRLIERIKTTIIEQVHETGPGPLKLSVVLADKLAHDYTYLSNLFSSVEGQTIEKYHIAQKIERVKELLVYNELPLAEIAYQTGYSSVAHLSAQFKQVTGMTVSAFKTLEGNHRTGLENL